ncbi:hypothetical protein NDU88_003630 [Pleurodeles waltl]|uniref:Uncharacterized protein n=1 Tax=Pleurodeles waltl TaxID=8319 RepID=A0AAV7Q9I2_PLEWA|nr:hypothetical protein NDU88_003630 [Pleurodeles waltl]
MPLPSLAARFLLLEGETALRKCRKIRSRTLCLETGWKTKGCLSRRHPYCHPVQEPRVLETGGRRGVSGQVRGPQARRRPGGKRGSCGLDPVSGDFRLRRPGIPPLRNGQPGAPHQQATEL